MIKLKNLLTLLVLFLMPLASRAQINLVLNPSFEDYSLCPDFLNQINYCNHWNMLDTLWSDTSAISCPCGAPEFCNVCSTSYVTKVPDNSLFYHFPRSGNGMIQLTAFADYSDSAFDVRDYLQGKLVYPLILGHTYSITFFTAREQGSAYSVNDLGAYLDDGSIDTTHNPGWTQWQYTPQLVDTSVIYDTLDWTKISGTMIATGNERFITIGNFSRIAFVHSVLSIDTVGSGTWTGAYSWYLIDDVSVIDCGNQPQAGVDTIIVPGDSVYIGPHEGLLPYTWYAWGHTSPIDSGGGMWVHPDTTTTYILEQKLCGTVKYDTITVTISTDTAHHHVGVAPLAAKEGLHLYPNPASNELTISGLGGNTRYRLMDVTGYVVRSGEMHRGVNKLDMRVLPSCGYMIELVGEDGGRAVKRIVKE